MPFLILICMGIIGVLLFNLWRVFSPSANVKAAYLHIVEGSAQMKAWGTESFFNLSNDSVIMQGDRIRSSANAKFIVQFFDGTNMRLGNNADMSFNMIDDKSDTPEMDLHLYAGSAWFDGNANIEVTMNNVVIKSSGAGIFELENNGDQIARVISIFDNNVLDVDVMDDSGDKVVETETIGIGQQINFTNEILKAYWAHQSPTVLTAIDDDFKLTDWYLWNIKEGDNPTVFEKTVGPGGVGLVKVEPEVLEKSAAVSAVNTNQDVAATGTGDLPIETAEKAVAPAEAKGVSKPIIVSVAGGVKPDALGKYQVTSRVTTLSGTIKGADKVVVNGYTLTKFKAGDSSWSYFANADFDLMKAGENVYEVYGLDVEGKKGESLVLKVFYTPQAVAPAPAPSPIGTPAPAKDSVKAGA